MEQSKSLLWMISRQIFGWTLLGVGVAGLALPILPGWVFIGWGVITLAPDIPLFRRLLDWVERKVPQLKPAIRRAKRGDHKSSSPGGNDSR